MGNIMLVIIVLVVLFVLVLGAVTGLIVFLIVRGAKKRERNRQYLQPTAPTIPVKK